MSQIFGNSLNLYKIENVKMNINYKLKEKYRLKMQAMKSGSN